MLDVKTQRIYGKCNKNKIKKMKTEIKKIPQSNSFDSCTLITKKMIKNSLKNKYCVNRDVKFY